MTIIRWNPMTSMLRWPTTWDEEDWGVAAQASNLDVYETSEEVVVRAAVAGVDPDKVEITYEKGILSISATEEEVQEEGKKFYKRASRAYAYRVAVPGNIDLKAEPQAKVKHGIVTVTFTKAEEEKPKKIAVSK